MWGREKPGQYHPQVFPSAMSTWPRCTTILADQQTSQKTWIKISVPEKPDLHIETLLSLKYYQGNVFLFFFLYFSVKLTALIVYRNSSPALKSQCLSSAAGSAAPRHTQSPQINFLSCFRHHLCPISAAPGRDHFPSKECSFPSLSCRFWRWGRWHGTDPSSV